MYALRRLAMRLVCTQYQPHVNALNDQHGIFALDLAFRFTDQPPVRRVDLTRLQRASEGSGKSARGRRDDVVQGSRMRLGDER